MDKKSRLSLVLVSNRGADKKQAGLLSSPISAAKSFAELQAEIKRLDSSATDYWYSLGSLLLPILQTRRYQEGGFRSFANYCIHGLGFNPLSVAKLIKVVKFIDEYWQYAPSSATRANAYRLKQCGFTKLYMLHTLPPARLAKLLREGIDVGGYFIPLEQATISEIKQAVSLYHGAGGLNN
jgi:hypothetical protein